MPNGELESYLDTAATLENAGMPMEQAQLLARDPQNHHFIVPDAAAWDTVVRTGTATGQLGQALNDAMLAIERANAHRQNNFDGILGRGCLGRRDAWRRRRSPAIASPALARRDHRDPDSA